MSFPWCSSVETVNKAPKVHHYIYLYNETFLLHFRYASLQLCLFDSAKVSLLFDAKIQFFFE